MTDREGLFPKDVTQILHSLWHAPLPLNTVSARQGRGKKTLAVLCLSLKTLKCYCPVLTIEEPGVRMNLAPDF
ncbi:MAG: hypothetical protein V1689_07235 [Pseudomonadota bacterium]